MTRADSIADEIMSRRLWFPRFIGAREGRQRWTVFSWAGTRDLAAVLPVWFGFPDQPDPFVRESPVASLIAADDYFKEKIDPPEFKKLDTSAVLTPDDFPEMFLSTAGVREIMERQGGRPADQRWFAPSYWLRPIDLHFESWVIAPKKENEK